jgi:uncharacterized membrane protein (DUF485 family)
MRAVSYIITIIGLVIYIYSLTLDTYINEDEYKSKYREISGENRSEQFYELRDEYLTLKFPLADYGLTIVIVGLILLFVFNKGWSEFKTLPSKGWIIAIGLGAVLTTVIAYVADLFNEYSRGSAPHWADSLGIPLMSVPPMLILLLIWYGLNLIGLKGDFKAAVPVSTFRFRKMNYWYLIISIVTSIILVLMIIDGYFWDLIPGFLWLYFYISILIGKWAVKIEKINLEKTTKANSKYS